MECIALSFDLHSAALGIAGASSAGAGPKDRLQIVYVEAYDEYEAQEIAASMVADADYTMVQGVA